jgi:hypothetical protein
MLPEAPAGKRPQKWAGAANLVGRFFFRWSLGGFGPKLQFDVSPAPRFQALQHFPASRLDNRQRSNGAGPRSRLPTMILNGGLGWLGQD